MTEQIHKKNTIIALDAMGGDHGPSVTIPAAIKSIKENKIPILLVGDKTEVNYELEKYNPKDTALISIVPSTGVVNEDESPVLAYKSKPKASIFVAAYLVKSGKASGLVSMGSTGASIAASTVIYGTMSGVERGALGGPIIGYSPNSIIIDLGTNVDTKPEQLLDFGALGSIMSKLIYKNENPKIALLSVGKEKGKGNSLVKNTTNLLSNSDLNFVGNIEPDELLNNQVEVVLCDGFVGNIVLKLTESLGKRICDEITSELGDTEISQKITKSIFEKTNTLESFGGGPLLGVKGVSIVGHGGSGINAISNAISTAKYVIDSDLVNAQLKELERVRQTVK